MNQLDIIADYFNNLISEGEAEARLHYINQEWPTIHTVTYPSARTLDASVAHHYIRSTPCPIKN